MFCWPHALLSRWMPQPICCCTPQSRDRVSRPCPAAGMTAANLAQPRLPGRERFDLCCRMTPLYHDATIRSRHFSFRRTVLKRTERKPGPRMIRNRSKGAIFRAMPLRLCCLFSLVSTSHSVGAEALTSYPGYTGEYAGFSLVLDERFDELDRKIWKKGDGAVGEESMCRFTRQGVRIRDGVLELVVDKRYVDGSYSRDHKQHKGPYGYYCGELRTLGKKRIRYGRIEARMKAPDRESASGYISSLFTYVNEGSEDEREWEEIDVELEGGRPDKFQANLIYGRNAWAWWATRDYGAWEDKIDVGPVDEWRVFAIEWSPDRISWYVDGKLVKTLKSTDIDCDPTCVPPQKHPASIPDNEANLMINFWIPNDIVQNEFGGNKYRNQYPMIARYDWLRLYQYDAAPLENW
jgi:beta-glucanase (GH16 family)